MLQGLMGGAVWPGAGGNPGAYLGTNPAPNGASGASAHPPQVAPASVGGTRLGGLVAGVSLPASGAMGASSVTPDIWW